jgi:two-component system, NarL family, sensor kinase
MLKRWPILIIFFLLFSCEAKKENASIEEKDVFWYSRIVSDSKSSRDSCLYYSRCLDSTAENKPVQRAMAQLGYGIYYKRLGDFEKSIKAFQLSDSLATFFHADSISVRAQIGASQCVWNQGLSDKAIEGSLNALRLAEKINFRQGIAGAHINVAQFYQQSGKIDLARSHLQYAMKQSSSQFRERHYFIAAHTLANLYGMTGKIDSALVTDSLCLIELNKDQNKFQSFFSMFYDNQANCYLVTGQYDSSYAAYQRAIAQDAICGNASQVADGYLGLSNLFLVQNKLPEAREQLAKFLAYSKKINYKQGEGQAWGMISALYEREGKLELALQAKDSMRIVNEHLLNEKIQTRIVELGTIYETEKKDRELKEAAQIVKNQRIMLGVTALFTALLILLSIAYYQRYRNRTRQKIENAEREQELIATQAVFAGEQQERLRIGRDLHDSIGQQLAVLKMKLSSNDNTTAMLPLVENTLQELRNISHNLIPPSLQFGLVAALEELCIQISESDTKAIVVSSQALPRALLSPDSELAVFRIVQEIIGNSIKHASPQTITIRIEQHASSLVIEIKDDGKGFDTRDISKSNGRGWDNIRARASLLGAKFSVNSIPSKGTSSYLDVPFKK